MIPFARTAADRRAVNNPRASLEERYGSHAGYVSAMRRVTERAMAAGFMFRDEAERLIRGAQASKVLR
jgi:Alpha/beta hydrolase domain